MKRLRVLGVATLLVVGCSASTSDVSGGKLTATGCRSQVPLGDQLRIRAQWTAPKIGRYTLVRLDVAGNFTVNKVFDEALSHAQPNGVPGEYDLPGPRSAKTKKSILALITARRPGTSTITTRIWGSGDAVSAPPDNAASFRCIVAIQP